MTLSDDGARLREAWERFAWAFLSGFHIPRLAEWLESKITKGGHQ